MLQYAIYLNDAKQKVDTRYKFCGRMDRKKEMPKYNCTLSWSSNEMLYNRDIGNYKVYRLVEGSLRGTTYVLLISHVFLYGYKSQCMVKVSKDPLWLFFHCQIKKHSQVSWGFLYRVIYLKELSSNKSITDSNNYTV